MNYFELFEIPIGFDIDLSRLEKKYIELQLKYHPDRNLAREADVDAAYVNKAYTTLKDDISRAKHILEINGLTIPTNIEFDFLEIVMELKETNDAKKNSEIKVEIMEAIKQAFKNEEFDNAATYVAKYEMLKRF